MINPNEYAALVEFMQKTLFQAAAPTFDDAIRLWHETGTDSIRRVIREIDLLLSANYSSQDVDAFVDKHSEYAEDGGGVSTLEHIKEILKTVE